MESIGSADAEPSLNAKLLERVRDIPISVLAGDRGLRRAVFDALAQKPTVAPAPAGARSKHIPPSPFDLFIGDQEGEEGVDVATVKSAVDNYRNEIGQGKSARRLFDFDWDQELYYVVPLLSAEDPDRRAISIEDVQALKELLKLTIFGFPRRAMFDLKLPGEVTIGGFHNILTVCSYRRNDITRAILENDKIQSAVRCRFLTDPDATDNRWMICFDGKTVRSPSYDQETPWRREGRQPRQGPLTDVALIAKVANPFHPSSKFVVIAGVRAFGTLGAAQYLAQQHDTLLARTLGKDFAAIVKVQMSIEGKVSAEMTDHFRVVEPSAETR